ncbi:hypothetical protein BC830DRAFT_719725 [Chytriomyces sp. MP71]|nr:hypothetical protein BC830DRAFT_719725 [Chytriomyces sp. MP71]
MTDNASAGYASFGLVLASICIPLCCYACCYCRPCRTRGSRQQRRNLDMIDTGTRSRGSVRSWVETLPEYTLTVSENGVAMPSPPPTYVLELQE